MDLVQVMVALDISGAGLKFLSILFAVEIAHMSSATIVGLQPRCGNVRPYSIKYNVQIRLFNIVAHVH